MYGKSNMETYITICKNRQPTGICCMAQETQTGALYQPRRVGWGGSWEEVQKGGDICIPMPDSQVFPWASLVAQLVKNLPAMWETWVRFLGWEDPLEKGKATHSSILAWRIPWTV